MIIKKSNKKGKYIIYKDDKEIEVYEDVIIDLQLLGNREEEIDKIFEKQNYYEAYYRTLKYIDRKFRSEKEIYLYLSRFSDDSNFKFKIIENLKEKNYINDEEYARMYINDRLKLSKDGIEKIKTSLLYLGIMEDIIERQIKNIDIEEYKERLSKYINKYISINKKYSVYEIKNRTILYFINLGYKRDEINEILNDIEIIIDPTIIQKEYDKLFKKYKDKENKDNLIRNKLFQKGFTKEDIKKIRKD